MAAIQSISQSRGVGTRGARGAQAPLLKKEGGRAPLQVRASGNGTATTARVHATIQTTTYIARVTLRIVTPLYYWP